MDFDPFPKQVVGGDIAFAAALANFLAKSVEEREASIRIAKAIYAEKFAGNMSIADFGAILTALFYIYAANITDAETLRKTAERNQA